MAPDFAATRHVYVSYVARDTGGSRVGRVVRFREVGGKLGEAAVVLDDLPAGARAVRIRSRARRRDVRRHDGRRRPTPTTSGRTPARSCGSLPPAGRLPTTRPVLPLYIASGYQGRLDFDWEPGTGALWHVQSGPEGVSIGRLAAGQQSARAAFLEGIQASGVVFHAGAEPAGWRGSLFLTSPDHECLYRVSGLLFVADRAEGPAVVRAGLRSHCRGAFSADDGLYFATGNGGTGDSGRPADAVFRVRDR